MIDSVYDVVWFGNYGNGNFTGDKMFASKEDAISYCYSRNMERNLNWGTREDVVCLPKEEEWIDLINTYAVVERELKV
jgi:hypothetical protein